MLKQPSWLVNHDPSPHNVQIFSSVVITAFRLFSYVGPANQTLPNPMSTSLLFFLSQPLPDSSFILLRCWCNDLNIRQITVHDSVITSLPRLAECAGHNVLQYGTVKSVRAPCALQNNSRQAFPTSSIRGHHSPDSLQEIRH